MENKTEQCIYKQLNLTHFFSSFDLILMLYIYNVQNVDTVLDSEHPSTMLLLFDSHLLHWIGLSIDIPELCIIYVEFQKRWAKKQFVTSVSLDIKHLHWQITFYFGCRELRTVGFLGNSRYFTTFLYLAQNPAIRL